MMTANNKRGILFLLGMITSLLGCNAAEAVGNKRLRGNTMPNERALVTVPPNNDCSGAQEVAISHEAITGTTKGATVSQNLVGVGADSLGPAVWYRLSGTGEEYILKLDCGNSLWNAAVRVLSSNGCLAYEGDYFGRGEMCMEDAYLHIQTEEDQEYHIIVEGTEDQVLPTTGDFSLTFAMVTEAPTSAPSAVPSTTPTTTPVRRKVKLQSYFGNGIGEDSYLTLARDDLNRVICSRFIVFNPILETTKDENDSYSEFWLNPDGTLESIECTGGLVVTVDRGYDGTFRNPLMSEDEACENGVIRLANKAGNSYFVPQTGETLRLGRTTESQQTWLVREQRGPGYYNDYTGTHVLESAMCANQGLSHKVVENNGGLVKAFDRPAGLERLGNEPHGYASNPGTEWRIIYLD